jgi:hypothetical protein
MRGWADMGSYFDDTDGPGGLSVEGPEEVLAHYLELLDLESPVDDLAEAAKAPAVR